MKILILKTFPLSFDDWNKVGIIERELNLYKKIINSTKIKIEFFSYGNKRDQKYKDIINPVKIHTLNSNLKNYYLKLLNSFLIPFYFKNIFKRVSCKIRKYLY